VHAASRTGKGSNASHNRNSTLCTDRIDSVPFILIDPNSLLPPKSCSCISSSTFHLHSRAPGSTPYQAKSETKFFLYDIFWINQDKWDGINSVRTEFAFRLFGRVSAFITASLPRCSNNALSENNPMMNSLRSRAIYCGCRPLNTGNRRHERNKLRDYYSVKLSCKENIPPLPGINRARYNRAPTGGGNGHL